MWDKSSIYKRRITLLARVDLFANYYYDYSIIAEGLTRELEEAKYMYALGTRGRQRGNEHFRFTAASVKT